MDSANRNAKVILLFSLFFFFSTMCAYAEDFITEAEFSVDGASIWQPGDSAVAEVNDFFGLEWNESWDFGKIYHKTTNIPFYGTVDLGDYGVEAEITTDGKIGVQLNASIDSGSLAINSPVDIQLSTSPEISSGDNITRISTAYTLQSGTNFSTSKMDGSVKADLIFDVNAKLSGTGCIIDCKSTSLDLSLPEIKYNFFDVNATNPRDNGSAFLGAFTWNAEVPTVSTSGTLSPTSDLLSGNVSRDLRTMSSSGQDNAFTVSVDIDQFLTSIMGVPLGVDWSVGYNVGSTGGAGVSFDGDLLGAKLSANSSLMQSFDVQLLPKYSLEFDHPVYYNEEYTWHSTPTTSINNLTLGQDVLISSLLPTVATPTYSMDWRVSNETKAVISTTLDITVARFDAWLGWFVGSQTMTAGPVFQDNYELFSFDIALYENSWNIQGQKIEGESFSLEHSPLVVEFMNKDSFDLARSEDFLNVSIAKRDDLVSLVRDYTLKPATPTDEANNLLTKNPLITDFIFDYYDNDDPRIDSDKLCALLESFGVSCEETTPFLFGADYNIGADFQPIFTDDILTGLSATFFDMGTGRIPFADFVWDDLFDTSFVFLYDPVVGFTDINIYQRGSEKPSLFDYRYSSLDARATPVFVPDPVPEPSTILLLGSGLVGLAWYSRKRKKV